MQWKSPVETQLYWVSSRYYSPELCRWISPDSIEYLDPESINGLNLYAYCGNNPVMNVDPSGHTWYSVLWDWVNTKAGFLNPISTITALGSIAYYWYDVKHNGSSRDYSMPWERTADWLGGVNRGDYKKGSLVWGIIENLLDPIVIPFYLLFGF